MPGWLIIIICGVWQFGVSGGGGLAFLIAVYQGTVTRYAGPWSHVGREVASFGYRSQTVS